MFDLSLPSYLLTALSHVPGFVAKDFIFGIICILGLFL